MMRSALYHGTLTHARSAPVRYRFRHGVGFFLFDLDELPALSQGLRLFGHNRPALFSLHDRDYGDGRPVRQALLRWLAGQGVDVNHGPGIGRVLLLTQPRILGYVFNPVSFFYCFDAQGQLRCIVAEVNNTFGDRHRYVLDQRTRTQDGGHGADKLMHVSPFFGLSCHYGFTFAPETPSLDPGSRLRVAIRVREHDRPHPSFSALLEGRRGPLSDRALLWFLLRHPLQTLRVVFLIHYHALRLFLKGAPFHPRPHHDPEGRRRMHERTGQGRDAPDHR